MMRYELTLSRLYVKARLEGPNRLVMTWGESYHYVPKSR